MKTISILLALVNSLAASLVIAASLPAIQILRPATSLWNAAKVTGGVGVIVVGVLTWIQASNLAPRPQLMLFAGLFLVVLGTAGAVWTLHLGLVRGILQDQLFVFGGSLVMQGALSIWALLLAEGGQVFP